MHAVKQLRVILAAQLPQVGLAICIPLATDGFLDRVPTAALDWGIHSLALDALENSGISFPDFALGRMPLQFLDQLCLYRFPSRLVEQPPTPGQRAALKCRSR